MSDLVKQSIAELQDLVRCRCDPAYKDRGLHDPACEFDNAENVKVVADRIEELERILGLADDQRAEWERHCRAAEAKLAKAVEALGAIVVCDTWGLDHEVYMKCRTALAELKGDT